MAANINGRPIDIDPDERLIDVINRSGASVPQVCYHRQLGPIQTCDTCMVEAVSYTHLDVYKRQGLCYVTLIPAIIFLVVAPYNQNRLIRFHAWQSIFLLSLIHI